MLADGVELRLLSTAIWDMMRPSSYRPLSVFGQQSALSHVWLVNSILSFNCAAYGAPPGQDPNDPGIVLLAAVGESIDLSFLALQLGEGQVMLRQQEEYATAFVVGPIQVRGVVMMLGSTMGQPLGSSGVTYAGVWGASPKRTGRRRQRGVLWGRRANRYVRFWKPVRAAKPTPVVFPDP